MLLLKRFFTKKRKADAEGGSDCKTHATEASISTSTSNKDFTKLSRATSSKSSKNISKVKIEDVQQQLNAKLVNEEGARKLMVAYNNFTTIEDFIALFVSEKSVISFEDDFPNVIPRQSDEAIRDFHLSLPDIKFTYDSIKETEAGEATIENLKCTGTHTGAPYTMVPGLFPPIPTTGKHLKKTFNV